MVSLRLVVSLVFVVSGWAVSARAQTPGFGSNMTEALVHYRLGNEYLARELWNDAREEFTEAVRREPLFTDAHYGLGQAYLGLERYTSAIQSFERFIASARSLHMLRLRQARNSRERTRFEVPAPVLLSLGAAHFHNAQPEIAERYWLEAVKVDPGFGEAWNNLAVVYLRSGRQSDAEAAIRKAERAGFQVHPNLKGEILTAQP